MESNIHTTVDCGTLQLDLVAVDDANVHVHIRIQQKPTQEHPDGIELANFMTLREDAHRIAFGIQHFLIPF